MLWEVSHREATAGNAPQIAGFYDDLCVEEEPARSVEVLARPAGSAEFTVIATTTTDSSGRFRVAVRPDRTTAYRLRINGQPAICDSAPVSTSGSTRDTCSIGVHTRVGVIVGTVTRNPVSISGELLPRYGGKPVGLAEIVDGRWLYRGQTRTDAAGRYQLFAATDERRSHHLVVYTSAARFNMYGSASVRVCPLCR